LLRRSLLLVSRYSGSPGTSLAALGAESDRWCSSDAIERIAAWENYITIQMSFKEGAAESKIKVLVPVVSIGAVLLIVAILEGLLLSRGYQNENLLR
jgi:hypothetical protein